MVIGVLLIVILVEAAAITVLTLDLSKGSNHQATTKSQSRRSVTYGRNQTFDAQYADFNVRIADDTELNATYSYKGSWVISIRNYLSFDSISKNTEAQVAIGPIGPTEALSIPTLIVQERSDGLIRIEYYEQNWPNTYGLILYNSTVPGWSNGAPLILEFDRFAPPCPVNPDIAPLPDGNLTMIMNGRPLGQTVYPIAWASTDSFYVYGLQGSAFVSGHVMISVAETS